MLAPDRDASTEDYGVFQPMRQEYVPRQPQNDSETPHQLKAVEAKTQYPRVRFLLSESISTMGRPRREDGQQQTAEKVPHIMGPTPTADWSTKDDIWAHAGESA